MLFEGFYLYLMVVKVFKTLKSGYGLSTQWLGVCHVHFCPFMPFHFLSATGILRKVTCNVRAF